MLAYWTSESVPRACHNHIMSPGHNIISYHCQTGTSASTVSDTEEEINDEMPTIDLFLGPGLHLFSK
jgi:hypothetical protein